MTYEDYKKYLNELTKNDPALNLKVMGDMGWAESLILKEYATFPNINS